eukprot:scaffold34917_cov166-Amphora_coffeaeformis.AAC.6
MQRESPSLAASTKACNWSQTGTKVQELVLHSPVEGAIPKAATGDAVGVAVGAAVSAAIMGAQAHAVVPFCCNKVHKSGGMSPASPAAFVVAHVCPSSNANVGLPITSPSAQMGHASYGGPMSTMGSFVGICEGIPEDTAEGWDETEGWDVGSSVG